MSRAPDSSLRQRTRRPVPVGLLALLALLGSFTARPAAPAAASAGDEAAFVTALNGVRAGVGLPPLTVNTELADLARDHARVMADAGEIFHANPISGGYTGPWTKIGENVGVGANVEVLVDAFVASPGHYANIVDPAFTQIGVGVVWKDSALYTTHRFLQVPGDPTPTTTVAPPTTTTTPPASTTTAPPPTSTTAAPTPTTTTTVPPLPAPAVTAERVVTLLGLLDRIGT